MRLSTDELMMLAPRLRAFLKTATPAWPEIVDAADWLRGELGVSKSLWGDACQAIGRETAAIAIVSAKPAEHFRSSPGGYLHGMVAKAKAGDLNLARTISSHRSGYAQCDARQTLLGKSQVFTTSFSRSIPSSSMALGQTPDP
jgi:replication initiation protein RepC